MSRRRWLFLLSHSVHSNRLSLESMMVTLGRPFGADSKVKGVSELEQGSWSDFK